jgi:serine/threonine-protein kinase
MAADLGRLLGGMAPDAGIAGPALLGAAAATPTAVADPTQTMPVRPMPLAAEPPPPPEEAAVDREESRRSGAGRAVLITLSVLLLLGLGAFAIFQLLSPEGETAGAVEVPSVIGSNRADAETQLRAANLVPQFKNVRGEDDETVGQAINQNPLGTTEVAPQTVVTVEINVGPATARIPSGLVGEDVDKVTEELERAGFTSIQTQPVADPGGDADKEEVLSIDPEEGESVALDEDIVIRYVADEDETESATPTSEPTDTSEPTTSSEPTASEDETTTEPTRSAKPTPKPTKTSASEEPTETPSAGEGPSGGEGPSENEQ